MKHGVLLYSLWMGTAAPLSAAASELYELFGTSIRVGAHYPASREGYLDNGVACRFDAPHHPIGITEAVTRALCHSPKVRAARARVLLRAAEIGQTLSAYLPRVTATVDNRRTEQDFQHSLGTKFSTTTHGYSLRFDWLLLDLGHRSAKLNQARALHEAANADYNNVLQQTILDVLKFYFDSIRAYASWNASRKSEELAKLTLETATARHQAGNVSLTDKLKAMNALSHANAERIEAEREWRKSQGALATELGLPPSTDLKLPDIDEISLRGNPIPKYEDLSVDDLVDQHPVVIAAAAEVAAAKQRIRLVRAEGMPALTLSGQYIRSPAPDSIVISPDNIVSIGIQLNIPLFHGFEPHYKTRGAEAELEARRALLEEIRYKIRLDIWRAYQDWLAAEENKTKIEALLDNVNQTLHITKGRYLAGIVDISEWLDAQKVKTETERARINAEVHRHMTRITLSASAGNLKNWILQ
ncbi:TolC family protein [Pelomicrobium sp.]|jgi:outer membrane protein|uniref:TolC family protein n=1 Tax=Pelomicrobium sp. TaxID=2815319 RepID=UPI002FDCB648